MGLDQMAIGLNDFGLDGYWTKWLLDQMTIGPNDNWTEWLLRTK